MAKGGAVRGGARKTAFVVGGGLFLTWLTVESAFNPFLDRLRAAVSRCTDPARDPDKATTVTAVEPSAPPLPADKEEREKRGDKEVELGEGAARALLLLRAVALAATSLMRENAMTEAELGDCS